MTLDKLKRIKLLLLDVDGVLTDGSVIYDDTGAEIKAFNAKDGLGIKMLMGAGIEVGIVTGRTSRALFHRCDNLGISLVFDQVRDKTGVLEVISKEKGVGAEHIAFVGDDLVDIPLMKKVGLSVAVADAHETVLEHADMVTSAQGGDGAVREVCEAILKAQGLWEKVLERFL
ncbi:MAG TPA: HAD-IIIA family hydrolase [Desulfatiglandales bacterium]|nr:HAD-IIIA family hydrolase [Desulfatiglandales bacterium]